ncbi:hypothetical protein [Sulfuricurvum sp.]|uniref:hypothetical protein n=2 Tax=Sulfuricurvum sp. TaxID=2025608 RepID=UPI002D78AC4F|nr:hypothetical protein [Sulfuricurvum sp.]
MRLILLLWFMASMSIANTHVHHDLNEHDNCVKCYAYNLMSGADAPISEPILFNTPQFDVVLHPDFTRVLARPNTCFNPRAPPSL